MGCLTFFPFNRFLHYSGVGWSVFVCPNKVRFVRSAVFGTVHKEEISPKRWGMEFYQIIAPKDGNRGPGEALLPTHPVPPQDPSARGQRLRATETQQRRNEPPSVFQRRTAAVCTLSFT